MRQRRFDGTNFKPRKRLENAQTPTSRVHAMLGGMASAIFVPNELRRIRQVHLLPLFTQCEITKDEMSCAICAPTQAVITLPAKGIQPIVDRNLLALLNRFPRIDICAFAHGVGVA